MSKPFLTPSFLFWNLAASTVGTMYLAIITYQLFNSKYSLSSYCTRFLLWAPCLGSFGPAGEQMGREGGAYTVLMG